MMCADEKRQPLGRLTIQRYEADQLFQRLADDKRLTEDPDNRRASRREGPYSGGHHGSHGSGNFGY